VKGALYPLRSVDTLPFGDDPAATGDFEIVGVVEDTVYTSVYWKNHSMYFIPMTQRPASWKRPLEQDESVYAGAIVIETQRPMDDMEKLTRTTLAAINPNLTVANSRASFFCQAAPGGLAVPSFHPGLCLTLLFASF
jgi:hypothetical protein